MSAAKKPAYAPRILKPVLKMQPHNITAYLVESHTPNVFHFCWVTPDGRYRCDCRASKFNSTCSHREALKAKLERLVCSSCGKSVPDRGQLREPAYVCEACKRQQLEAERLASLPRHLANVTVSEETKLERAEATAEANRQKMVDAYTKIDDSAARMDALYDTNEFWQDAQAERAAKREAAILDTGDEKEFSIFRS